MKRFFVVLILVGLAGLITFGCGPNSDDETVEEKIPVKVTIVKLNDVVQSLDYSGDITAEFSIKVFSKIPDRIENFYVEEGDYVSKGQKVAQVLATTIEQGVRQAEAAVTATKAQEANLRLEFARAQRLSNEDAMSQQQFDAVKTQFEAIQAQVVQAEAALVSTKSQLTDATISAPISGIIGKRYFEAGDMASPQFPVVTIVQMERVKFKFDVTENDYGKLVLGQKAQVSVRSFPEKTFNGKISKISPILDPMTRMAQVEVLIKNADKKLKPGMFGNVTVITGTLENILSVPRYSTIETTSLQRIDGVNQVTKKYLVFVVENEIAIQRELDVNYVNHVRLAINGGVRVGEKLVIEGQNNLRDSVAVAITEEEAAL
jgi:RND family efflux transporter MFP subunit